jgi:hypothetical protein
MLGFAWAGLFGSWRLADALPLEWETKKLNWLAWSLRFRKP